MGADVTVFTNLLISGQFIQFRNLDFIDESKRSQTHDPGIPHSPVPAIPAIGCMNLTNGLQKGYKNKEFYSLFLSKPFGASQLGRVNNIIIYEEGGGFWDRYRCRVLPV